MSLRKSKGPAVVSFGIIALLLMLVPVLFGQDMKAAFPPVAEKIPHVDTLFGDIRVDDYYWLRDRGDSNVIDYLKAENAYTDAVMAPTKDFQDAMYKEILGRIKETDINVPYRFGDYYYYSRTEEGKNYPIFCRKKGSLKAKEEIYLDQNAVAEGYGYLSIGTMAISTNQNILAYSIDTSGAERYTLFFKDLKTGKLYSDAIEDVGYSVEWANDNQTIFYTIRDEANRPFKLFRHKLGTKQSDDAMVHYEEDDVNWVGLGKTKNKKYLLMSTGTRGTDEYWYLDANNPTGEFAIIQPRIKGLEYSVDSYGDKFFIVTNDNAINFKLVETPVTAPSKENWVDVIPANDAVKIDNIDLFKDYMVVWERAKGLIQVQIRNMKNGDSHYIEFPEPVYSADPGPNPEFDSKILRLNYVSLVTPQSVYDYHMDTKKMDLLKQREVLGGYDKTQYTSERVFAPSYDGKEIPISLVYKTDLFKKDHSNPMYLYVYGAYGYSMDPYFSTSRLSLLDRGFVFAIAHVRGGGEMGRQWYDDGKMLNKMNTFRDVIWSSEYLIARGYTAKNKLVLSGGSAGGTTVGASMNMRPDLFEIVVAQVPFVDVINTELDPTIPLTTIEWEEIGNPHEEKYYRYMLQYSPYDNVQETDYPTLLVTTSLNDPRVAFWEPAKWTAKLRAMKTNNNPLLLKINMDAGHGGSSGRYDFLKEIAFEYVFILSHFDIYK